MFDNIKAKWQELLDEHPKSEKAVSTIGAWLPPLNYITIHYGYFISIIVVSSLIFWGSSNPFGSVDYVDSLFLVTSALTNTGLNTLNLSELTTWQQVQLWFLLMIGSPIWISFWTVLIRKQAFERRFEAIVESEREKRRQRRELRKQHGRGLKRAPHLHNVIPFKKHLTDPNNPDAGIGLSGLGSRIRASLDTTRQSNELTEFRPGNAAHRSISTPLTKIPSEETEGKSDGNTAVAEPVQDPEFLTVEPRDHIQFVEPSVAPHHLDKVESRTSAYQQGNHLTSLRPRRTSDATTAASEESEDFLMHWKKFLGKHNVSRSGQFYDLSTEEREHLGGCEYRALKILAFAVPFYSAMWQFLGAVALACYMALRTPDIPRDNGENPWWSGIFYSVSAFNNGGFGLLDDSVIPFQSHYFVLIVVGLLILAGNTAYPIFLRLGLWTWLKVLNLTTEPQAYAPWKETLEFILNYPRRVYTTLFPSRATWWLVAVLFVTNIIDWVAFELLNIDNPTVSDLPVGDQIMAGLFQAISVRACGFVVVSISGLYVGIQVIYLIMMYISVYPVVITMRNSNVYEERSLGIYDDDDEAVKEQERVTNPFVHDNKEPDPSQFLKRRSTAAVINKQLKRAATFQGVGVHRAPTDEETSRTSFIGQQIRGQLAHDLWWLVLAIFIIVVIETDHFLTDPVTFSVFNILFEGTSAYACVGLSIGLPNDSFAFSGALHKGSKVIMSLVMLRGRHRGLPVAIDRAVRLPGEKMQKEEDEDVRIRRTKTMHRMLSRDG